MAYLPAYCYSKRDFKSVDGSVIHFISAKNILPDDPFNRDAIMGIFKKYRVSAHHYIERDGNTIDLIPPRKKAFHAGKSIMNGREGCNNFTMGTELAGGVDFEYTKDQIAALADLLAQQMTTHRFTLDWVQGHDKVRTNWKNKYPDALGRNGKPIPNKYDPGSNFPWEELREMLIGVSDGISS